MTATLRRPASGAAPFYDHPLSPTSLIDDPHRLRCIQRGWKTLMKALGRPSRRAAIRMVALLHLRRAPARGQRAPDAAIATSSRHRVHRVGRTHQMQQVERLRVRPQRMAWRQRPAHSGVRRTCAAGGDRIATPSSRQQIETIVRRWTSRVRSIISLVISSVLVASSRVPMRTSCLSVSTKQRGWRPKRPICPRSRRRAARRASPRSRMTHRRVKTRQLTATSLRSAHQR